MNIILSEAVQDNLEVLLGMNKNLIEDEKYDRPLKEDKLIERWNSFLTQTKYKVFLFKINSDIIGYAVVHINQEPLYLRHFFIKRKYRRKGHGTECFNKLLSRLKTTEIDLDVMSWNKPGLKFWISLGFTERCKLLTINKSMP